MSEDAPAATRVLRYLLPASLDAYSAPKVRAAPFYPVLDSETRNGVPFPNMGLFAIRRQMRDDLLGALRAP